MAKKNKKELEPQYYTSQTNMPTYNYKVYYMSKIEKIAYFLLAFVVGAAIGYLFFGGLGKDQFGQPTKTTYIVDAIVCLLVGFVAGKMFLPIRTRQIIEKKQKTLNIQFRDMLEAISTSLGTGKNVVDSFQAAYDDLQLQYEEGAFILQELEIILSGMANNIDIEELLLDFGIRSGNEDIVSFATVFQVCYRKGGNIKDTIRATYEILNDKMEIASEIETSVSASKMNQNIMIVMPIALIGIIKVSSPDFASNFATPTGVMATFVAIVLFVIAYFVGKKILAIDI